MDPWSNTEERSNSDNSCSNQFEDNFVAHPDNDKLPDSEKYLATLEEKLHKIKSNPNVMEQLAKKKEECLSQLLHDSEGNEICAEELSLDEPIDSSAILRTILPQKQALTHGEIVELLKYDRLENTMEVESPEKEKSDD